MLLTLHPFFIHPTHGCSEKLVITVPKKKIEGEAIFKQDFSSELRFPSNFFDMITWVNHFWLLNYAHFQRKYNERY